MVSPEHHAAGIAGRVAAGAGWPGRMEILRFRRWAWICHLGPPFACKHRLKHRNRAPGQQGLRVGANLLGRNLDGNQIAGEYRTCAGHADLLFRDGGKRQAGKCDCLLEFTSRPELSLRAARIWPQQHMPERLKSSATRNSRHFLRCGGQARTVSEVDITAVIGSQLTYCVEVAAELLADVEEQTVRSVHQAQRPG